MSNAVVLPKDFKTSNVSISPPKVIESTGGKFAMISYDSAPLKMQVSSVPIPYGMSVFDKAGPKKYSVDLSLKGYEVEGSKMKAIYDAFISIDDYMVEQGIKNSKLWFKSELNREVIKAFYSPIVRFSKDAEGNPKPYPPTVKINLKQKDDKFETVIYDDKKRPLTDIPLEDVLVKGAIITSLIQCTGVWFAGSKYGLSWKAVQIRTDHLPESIRGYAMKDEDDISGALASTSISSPPPPSPSTNKFAALADDEEIDDEEAIVAPPTKRAPSATIVDEDEDDDVIEPVAVPAKKPATITKKVITKSIGIKK